jgi:hypothetical protein
MCTCSACRLVQPLILTIDLRLSIADIFQVVWREEEERLGLRVWKAWWWRGQISGLNRVTDTSTHFTHGHQ